MHRYNHLSRITFGGYTIYFQVYEIELKKCTSHKLRKHLNIKTCIKTNGLVLIECEKVSYRGMVNYTEKQGLSLFRDHFE